MSKIGRKSKLSPMKFPCLLQRARMERHISTWDKPISEIEMSLDRHLRPVFYACIMQGPVIIPFRCIELDVVSRDMFTATDDPNHEVKSLQTASVS